MGVFEKFKDLVGIEEYDEDYEDDAALEKAEKTPEPAKPMPPQRKVMPETPLPGKVLPMSPKLPITGLSGAGDNPFKMVIRCRGCSSVSPKGVWCCAWAPGAVPVTRSRISIASSS